jgi:S-adenosylmethionine uptake transporter
MVFIRSLIGIMFSLILVQIEGGWSILRSRTPGLHLMRGFFVIVSNMTYFAALAALPLADATALFFVAPLMITLLSIPLLGEKVGPMRLGAVVVGFCGMVIMLRPWDSAAAREASLIILFLPVVSALFYALNQIMTRKLGATTKASAMAVYIQAMFIVVGGLFWLVAGDGRYAEGIDNPSIIFLLRAWAWPVGNDIWMFVGLGLNSALVGYTLAQAYRMADAATVAPFEYIGLPLAVLWGWLFFDHLPGPTIAIGIAMIMGSGLFVFFREQYKNRGFVSKKRIRRR